MKAGPRAVIVGGCGPGVIIWLTAPSLVHRAGESAISAQKHRMSGLGEFICRCHVVSRGRQPWEKAGVVVLARSSARARAFSNCL
jgi:hypothetical protein